MALKLSRHRPSSSPTAAELRYWDWDWEPDSAWLWRLSFLHAAQIFIRYHSSGTRFSIGFSPKKQSGTARDRRVAPHHTHNTHGQAIFARFIQIYGRKALAREELLPLNGAYGVRQRGSRAEAASTMANVPAPVAASEDKSQGGFEPSQCCVSNVQEGLPERHVSGTAPSRFSP